MVLGVIKTNPHPAKTYIKSQFIHTNLQQRTNNSLDSGGGEDELTLNHKI